MKTDKTTPGAVITVTSQRGGAGKSTVTMGLAMALLDYGLENGQKLDICVADFDVRDPQLNFLFGGEKAKSYPINLRDEDNRLLNLSYSKSFGVYGLLIPNADPEYDILEDKDWHSSLFKTLRNHFDFVIVDSAIMTSNDGLRDVVIPETDALIEVVNSALDEPLDARLRKSAPEDMTIPDALMVINNIGFTKEPVWADEVVAVIPQDTKAVQGAWNAGDFSEIFNPTHEVGAGFRVLTEAVIDAL